MSTNIALLIPVTSKNQNWTEHKTSFLYKLTLSSFLKTYNNDYYYKFFIGYDKDDCFFNNKMTHDYFKKVLKNYKNIDIEFIEFPDIKKGYLTKMWNYLFEKALFNRKYFNYFFQCGDDICFKTSQWSKSCILKMQENNGIGVTGPMNNNNNILTQTFVSRKHFEIFGFYFPEEIVNWGCDDWINYVYSPKYLYILIDHYCSNDGGQPRYDINNNKNNNTITIESIYNIRMFAKNLAFQYKNRIEIFKKNSIENSLKHLS